MLNGKKYIKELFGDARPAQRMLDNVNSGQEGLAGLGDIQRPAEKLSVSQSSALAATGVVWSRYSLVIIPKNWSLFSVNVFVAITNFYQLTRAVRYQRSLKIKEENKL
ncbi:mitochondrial pyruvate carrier 2-like [Lycorma delicatula]|uniref:mitochondrial pyruvate carrier 2-like n=1 Tax=Lycorma delicatula TaxID=130591 RepID=UPI003F5192AE